jgi:hypothetical protein
MGVTAGPGATAQKAPAKPDATQPEAALPGLNETRRSAWSYPLAKVYSNCFAIGSRTILVSTRF